jgi:hypothetical protein
MKPSEVIKQRGWCRHYQLHPTTGAVCIRGAIDAAYGRAVGELPSKEWEHAMNRIADAIGFEGLSTWNDDLVKDEKAVIALLESVGE